ncbi:MAG: hypothetical protein N2446_00370 [Elusimicrobiales bacterium]|nr:hypothetical protein [Elusimicrobiales bacterium]
MKLNSEKRLANVVVDFEGIKVIFGILKSNGGFFVLSPKEFFFIDKHYKESVFRYIIDLWKGKK